jgi:hypothetical protein
MHSTFSSNPCAPRASHRPLAFLSVTTNAITVPLPPVLHLDLLQPGAQCTTLLQLLTHSHSSVHPTKNATRELWRHEKIRCCCTHQPNGSGGPVKNNCRHASVESASQRSCCCCCCWPHTHARTHNQAPAACCTAAAAAAAAGQEKLPPPRVQLRGPRPTALLLLLLPSPLACAPAWAGPLPLVLPFAAWAPLLLLLLLALVWAQALGQGRGPAGQPVCRGHTCV